MNGHQRITELLSRFDWSLTLLVLALYQPTTLAEKPVAPPGKY